MVAIASRLDQHDASAAASDLPEALNAARWPATYGPDDDIRRCEAAKER